MCWRQRFSAMRAEATQQRTALVNAIGQGLRLATRGELSAGDLAVTIGISAQVVFRLRPRQNSILVAIQPRELLITIACRGFAHGGFSREGLFRRRFAARPLGNRRSRGWLLRLLGLGLALYINQSTRLGIKALMPTCALIVLRFAKCRGGSSSACEKFAPRKSAS